MKKVRELLEFNRLNNFDLDQLLEYITVETLEEFGAFKLFLTIIRSNGAMYNPAAYGVDVPLLRSNPERLLDSNSPGYDAFVNGRLIEEGGDSEYPFYFPENVPIFFPDGFAYSVFIPVPTFGALPVFCSKENLLDSGSREFLLAIGEFVALYLEHGSNGVRFNIEADINGPTKMLPLTSRQWLIHDAMLRGLTNGSIAKEMNFSESLIRHETIRIYAKLQIKGRKEMFKLDGVNELARDEKWAK